MQHGTIHYGFGKDYLPQWSIKEALREIYQNFLDYGDYEVNDSPIGDSEKLIISVQNGWDPESLDFLRIGNSQKNKANAVGKHGEGMKMAFLILLREGLKSSILTPRYEVWPDFYIDQEIGECFCLKYTIHDEPMPTPYTLTFECDRAVHNEFLHSIIKPEDVIFDDKYWGQIVEKPAGNIYSGGLFVTAAKNISKAYNINPQYLPLDRDRSVPRSFDLNYASSKINEAQGKYTVDDLSMSDTSFITQIPDSIKETVEPVLVGNSIEFKHTDALGQDKIISNPSVKEQLIGDSFFASAIKRLKHFVAKQLGLYDMLVEFRDKHVHDSEALIDFELILERVDEKSNVRRAA
ncbi:hypothetical protein [Mucilaginibacter sp. SP1R1]|uniref:hypothetical protein n=1 Tax=Mucilaginibacter sp. SP1R1 TaxID=2723091 RepID=UPI00161E807C|nr:hypothetical protein [Mucilaginibacter sp. SP1R1]MBB6152287.1 hypothetical protein [Mucilaginibacter sp. SP1R1]